MTMDSRHSQMPKEKNGIDYLTEAKDFQNVINNLKTLLNKGS